MAKNESNDYYMIDLTHILKVIWRKAWLVVVIGILGAVIGYCYARFGITPQYASSTLLYVNNSSISLKNTSLKISTADISAAQNLLRTYTVLLKNRTTLTKVIESSGVDYTYEQLAPMISATSVDDTEVLRVMVTTDDPYKSAKIANCIAEVLPRRVAEIVDGCSMEVVDRAVPNKGIVSPSYRKYTVTGFAFGVLFVLAILVIVAVMDNTIHDDNYILENYDYPILARIPDLLDDGTKRYGYKRYGYYYKKQGYYKSYARSYENVKDGDKQ